VVALRREFSPLSGKHNQIALVARPIPLLEKYVRYKTSQESTSSPTWVQMFSSATASGRRVDYAASCCAFAQVRIDEWGTEPQVERS
jgi:hypothetical protein